MTSPCVVARAPDGACVTVAPWMLTTPPGQSTFEAYRDELLEMLVGRFQSSLDYRDSLDAAEPPCPEPKAADPRRTAERPALDESVRQSTEAKSRSD